MWPVKSGITRRHARRGDTMSENIPVVNRWCCKIIPVSDIVYIFSNYRKSEIHTMDEMIPVYYPRSEIEGYLDGRFQHCLKSLIVNFDKISYISDGVIKLKNGEEITLGRGNYIKVKQKFAMYIRNNKKTLAKAVDL